MKGLLQWSLSRLPGLSQSCTACACRASCLRYRLQPSPCSIAQLIVTQENHLHFSMLFCSALASATLDLPSRSQSSSGSGLFLITLLRCWLHLIHPCMLTACWSPAACPSQKLRRSE